jgi:AmmeMemoRadiSam system protein A
MDEQTRKKLLSLARKAIVNVDNKKELDSLSKKKVVNEEAGVFVSVYVNEELRGCIGSLEPIDLNDGIIEHAILAAYRDSRFEPINEYEFKDMKIHINILTKPKPLEFKDSNDLLKKLNKKNGYIIEKGYRKATFLPSVWEQLEDKEEFLQHLCMKAGLEPNEWKAPGMKFYFYESQEFSE